MKNKAWSLDQIHWYPMIWVKHYKQYVELDKPVFKTPRSAIRYADEWCK